MHLTPFTILRYAFIGIISIASFAVISQVSQIYTPQLQTMMLSTGIFAPLTYIFITILSIVVAPLGSSFLLPIAANTFGPFLTALYSIISWLIGSMVVFYLSRRYGHGKIQKLKVCEKVRAIERDASYNHLVLIIILLRLALPVDVFSYALGLFSSISYRMFFWTTLIGVAPFAFMFTYSAVLPVGYQIAVSMLSMATLAYALYFLTMYAPKNDTK